MFTLLAITHPVLIIDEAQDLNADRVRILSALATRVEVLAAADEFQCLDPNIRPNPAMEWLAAVGQVINLTEPRRTNIADLLDAAAALRAGKPPVSQDKFKIVLASNSPLAGTWASHAIAWYAKEKTVAVISPSYKGYAQHVVEWSSTKKTNKGIGPINIRWEKAESAEIGDLVEQLQLPDEIGYFDLVELVRAKANGRVATDVKSWADVQRRALGRQVFSRDEVIESIIQSFSSQKRLKSSVDKSRCALTVHGAKNREFDQVIVLWPAGVVGDDDQRRRLLYNAVTRARERCLVLVQASKALQLPPFV
ncbi:ATP-binding domain-containing protein [Uliginosibacterium sp. 31-16]|uniref:ATP-binding domain-containing protein n=1 Tax=Uliginosibacterium sp. 31-16 TaxID=3068315 RepID=UPI00273D9A0C|nr:ATP-binding domain-containing protein [Uliginosibacterium sp. 31-16]MDP5239041.1 ATP-binding domain-containing protein [Uliginosibacterium sp. 31-16]